MPDLLYLMVTVAFFAAVAGFVTLCDRIIGPDSDHGSPQGAGESEPVVAIDGAGLGADLASRADLVTPAGAVR